MQRKKLLAFAASAMTLAVTLTACGNKPSAPVDNPNKGELSNKSAVEKIEAASPEKLPDTAKNRKDTIIIGIDEPKGVFNPFYYTTAYDDYVLSSIFAPLFAYKEDGDLDPVLAEKYEISQDGKTYTYTLKKDLKWSDGKPITSKDIEFSYKVMADGKYTGRSDVESTTLKGVKEYREGTANNISGIKIIDDRTISFTLEDTLASAKYDLNLKPIPEHYYGQNYKQGEADKVEALHRKPIVSSGPYKFKEFTPGQQVVLEANESYVLGKAKIPNLIYRVTNKNTALQLLGTGEVDINALTVTPENVQQVKDKGFLTALIYPTNGYGYIGFNCASPKLKDEKVRQALAYGLDRKSIVQRVYKGYADVINIPQSKVSWAYTDDVEKYEFSTEKANKLLDEAGWKKGADGIREKDGVKLKLNFLASTPNEVNDAIIPIAQQNYKQLGIEFVPEQMDFNSVMDKTRKAKDENKPELYDMYFAAWGLTPEPDSTTIFGTGKVDNRGVYSNKKVDELLAKGLRTIDPTERKKVYQDLYKELNRDLPYIYVYNRRDMWVTNSRVKNYKASSYRYFYSDMHNFELK